MNHVVRTAIAADRRDAWPVLASTKLQILIAVVEAIAVDVVHRLFLAKQAAKARFHYQPMFSDVASSRVRVIWFVNVDIAMPYAASLEVPVRRSWAPRAMASYEWNRVTIEVPPPRIGRLRDGGRPSATTFTETRWNLLRLRNVTMRRWAASLVMPRQIASGVVACALRGWSQWLTTTTFAQCGSWRVDHQFIVTPTFGVV